MDGTMPASRERTSLAIALATLSGVLAWPALDAWIGLPAVTVSGVLGGVVLWIAVRCLPRSLDGSLRRRSRQRGGRAG